MAKYEKKKFRILFPKLKKSRKRKNVFNVLAFDPIEGQILLTTQNDHQNLSFLKNTNVVGKKMTRKGLKMGITKVTIFLSGTHVIRKHVNLLLIIRKFNDVSHDPFLKKTLFKIFSWHLGF